MQNYGLCFVQYDDVISHTATFFCSVQNEIVKHINTVTKSCHKLCHKILSRQLNRVKLATTCSLFLTIHQLTVINQRKSYICCGMHRQKFTFNRNLHLIIMFALSSLPVL